MNTKIDVERAGVSLAHADDREQAQFLNAFGDALMTACRTHGGNYSLQLAYISDHMTLRGKEVIRDLAGYCKEN